MIILELKDPKILGEEHPQYGFTFWSLTDGDYPVMFNSKQGNIMPGTRVMAEESDLRTSKNGTEYLRLKKVKLEDSPVSKEEQIPFTEKPKPSFTKKAEPKFSTNTAYLKDLSDYPVRLYNGSLSYAKEAGLNLIGDTEDRRAYLEYVMDVSNELLEYSEKIRNSGALAEMPTLSATLKEVETGPSVKPATGLDKARRTANQIKQKAAEEDSYPDGYLDGVEDETHSEE